ncbi:hypothetical protein PVE90_11365 [Pseudomonas carnis]|nr:hypothetical protein [Pseudomonas carnis]
MRKTAFPKKLYFLLATALLWGVLAYLSRYETHLPVRKVFKLIGFGNASLIEHFTGGFAATAVFLAILLFALSVTSKARFIKSPIRVLAFGKFRRWLMTRTRPAYITHWTAILASAYIVISLAWEVGQIEKHGFFQLDQFGMDLMGALAFCLCMRVLLKKNLQHARTHRSFSLV